jgi:hypothetical protein
VRSVFLRLVHLYSAEVVAEVEVVVEAEVDRMGSKQLATRSCSWHLTDE